MYLRWSDVASSIPAFSLIILCPSWRAPCPVPFRRLRVSSQIRVWGMPASHLRPLLDESQRFLMARGVFAVHRVSTASHHQLLLQRKETLLQTRLPTVRTISGREFLLSFSLVFCFFFVLHISRFALVGVQRFSNSTCVQMAKKASLRSLKVHQKSHSDVVSSVDILKMQSKTCTFDVTVVTAWKVAFISCPQI